MSEIKVDIAKTKVIVNVFEKGKHVLELKFKNKDYEYFEYLIDVHLQQAIQKAIKEDE